MGQIVLKWPDSQDTVVYDAVARSNGYRDIVIDRVTGEQIPNPITKRQFLLQLYRRRLQQDIEVGEVDKDTEVTRDATITRVNNDIPIT